MTTFLIEYQCPQCGAPATLEENERLFTCQFCRVTSYLLQNPFPRYVLPQVAPENKELYLLPYWRFKGTLFSAVSGGVRHRFMDVSHQALRSDYFPLSVGFRSQALKLKFALPETRGRFLQPSLSLNKAMKIFSQRFCKELPESVYHQEFIGETLSIIYSPFYIGDRMVDAVLNRPISCFLPENFSPNIFTEENPTWKIKFIPALCPDCGWDLSGESNSLVLLCPHCNSVWLPKGKGLRKIKFGVLKEKGDVYLPFWRIKSDIKGISLASYADLIKVANLPTVCCRSASDNLDFYFWTLAFKVRPRVFLRLNRNITLSQPPEDHSSILPKAKIYPVTLPATEAVESLKINLATFACPEKHYLPLLSSIKIEAREIKLVYIPFKEKHHEFIQERLCLTLNKNQVMLASNL